MRHRLEADRRGCRHLAFVLYYCFPRCATTDSRTLRRQHPHCFFSLSFPQRAAAALRAMSLRRLGVSFAARALPPILPAATTSTNTFFSAIPIAYHLSKRLWYCLALTCLGAKHMMEMQAKSLRL